MTLSVSWVVATNAMLSIGYRPGRGGWTVTALWVVGPSADPDDLVPAHAHRLLYVGHSALGALRAAGTFCRHPAPAPAPCPCEAA